MKGFLLLALLAALLHQASCWQTNHLFRHPHSGPYMQSQEDSFPVQPLHHAYSRLRQFLVRPEITPTVNSKENDNTLTGSFEDPEDIANELSMFKSEQNIAPKKYQMRRGQQAQYSSESYSPEQTQLETFYFLPIDATRKAERDSLFLNEDSPFRGSYQPEFMFSEAQTE